MADLKESGASIHRHPWEICRAKEVMKVVNNLDLRNLADIGAGDLYFDNLLASQNTQLKITAVDANFTDLKSDNPQITKAKDIAELSENAYDLIIMMDVLEHIEYDSQFLQAVETKLKEDGKIIITVPAHQNLFSSHDQFLEHFRRYDKHSLKQVISSTNLQIVEMQYFFASLFLIRRIMAILEKVKSKKIEDNKGIGGWKYSEKHLITKIFIVCLSIDLCFGRVCNALKIPLLGLSLLAVVERGDKNNN